jgi:hypothetical protein
MHHSTKDTLSLALDQGYLEIIDLDSSESIYVDKVHQFDIWFTQFSVYNPELLFTCSDDASFKLLDKRGCVAQTNKKHQAGVTCLL